MRLVFCDFDGVLNSHEYMRRLDGERDVLGVDPVAVARLNRLLVEGCAEVVVSSSWRHGRTLYQLREILVAAGFTGTIVGKTPDLGAKCRGSERGNEIQAWMDLAPLYDVRVGQFVILDDDSDMAHLGDRYIKTKFETGLTDADVDRGIEMLGEPVKAIVVASGDDVLRFT